MDFLPLALAAFVVFANHPQSCVKEPTKQVTRNFMVTECTKKTGCLMKMRPHLKVVGKDGSVSWQKVQ